MKETPLEEDELPEASLPIGVFASLYSSILKLKQDNLCQSRIQACVHILQQLLHLPLDTLGKRRKYFV